MNCGHVVPSLHANSDSRKRELREHALLALRFPLAAKTVAAFLYGIAPQARIIIEGEIEFFRVARRQACPIPLSRLIESNPKSGVEGAILTQSFSAYCLSAHSNCTMLDLMDDSRQVCSVANIGRLVRDSISRGDAALSPTVARAAADRADVFLLALVGDAISPRFARAIRVLEAIQSTGEEPSSRAQWLHQLMHSLSWDLDAAPVTSVVDEMIPVTFPPSPRERLAARTRVASALLDV